MKKNLKINIIDKINAVFDSPETTSDKSWRIVHNFYNAIMTKMEKDNLSQSDLARALDVSRSAVNQSFHNNPRNMTVKKMVELSEAVGLSLNFEPVNNVIVVEEKPSFLSYQFIDPKPANCEHESELVVVEQDSSNKHVYPIFQEYFKQDYNNDFNCAQA